MAAASAAEVLSKLDGVDKFVYSAEEVVRLVKESGLQKADVAAGLCWRMLEKGRYPVSNFAASAVLEGGSGAFYVGVNVEFLGVGVQETVHAEQCAVSAALAAGEESVVTITTCPMPCGYCRQFLRECNNSDTLHVHSLNKDDGSTAVSASLLEILPYSFSPTALDNPIGALSSNGQSFSISTAPSACDKALPRFEDALSLAKESLPRAYAPYTNVWAAVVLCLAPENEGGQERLVVGVNIENVAFNPSFQPMQAAACMAWKMGALAEESIRYCLLVQTDGRCSTAPATLAVMKALAPKAPVVVLRAECAKSS